MTAAPAGIVARETVGRQVFECCTALAPTSTVTSHLTALTGRLATDRLTAPAQAEA